MSISRIVGVLVIAAAVLVVSQARADLCKDPNVKVVNDKANTIKVTKIEYYDECDNKWRTEDVNSTEIEPGHYATFHDDLEHVGNCAIRGFKLYRAVRQNTGGAYGAFVWGGELTPEQGKTQVCQTNVLYTIHAYD